MKDTLIIVGAGGHGKVAADIAIKMLHWKTIVFVDDNIGLKTCLGLQVIGTIDSVLTHIKECDFFVAVGNNIKRKELHDRLEGLGASIVTLKHPQAVVGGDVSIGLGSVIMAGAIINCSTTIGKGCIVNTNSSVDHDSTIGDYVHISPGALVAGSVRIGDLSWLGAASVVINNINVCENCIVGAGATVIRDLLSAGTYIGSPARKIDSV